MDILKEIFEVTLSTVVDVLPIAAIIFGFKFAVIRRKPANLASILFGFAWVLAAGWRTSFGSFPRRA